MVQYVRIIQGKVSKMDRAIVKSRKEVQMPMLDKGTCPVACKILA